MSDLDSSLARLRTAVTELLATADRAGATWTVPIASGKWSPSQVVEHVARIMEESANVAAGAPSKFPTMPGFLRPILRALFFKPILKKGAFSQMKSNEAFDPARGSATPAEGRIRVEAVLTRFDQACRARATSGKGVASTIFGTVAVADYARFQELHVRHHHQQMLGAA